MFFIEVLNFVEVQKYSRRAEQSCGFADYLLDVRQRCRSGIEFSERHSRGLGDDFGCRGFSRTGRAVKYHIGDMSGFDHSASDSSQIITGGNSMLMGNAKERGAEKVITRLTYLLGFAFIVISFVVSYLM